MCASLAWATYSVMVRKWVFDVWVLTRFLAVASALVYIPIYLLWLPKNLSAAPWSMLALQAVYQGVITTIVAMLLFRGHCGHCAGGGGSGRRAAAG